jgi:hypothetical protein
MTKWQADKHHRPFNFEVIFANGKYPDLTVFFFFFSDSSVCHTWHSLVISLCTTRFKIQKLFFCTQSAFLCFAWTTECIYVSDDDQSRSQMPNGLRRESATDRVLGLRILIPPGACVCVFWMLCVVIIHCIQCGLLYSLRAETCCSSNFIIVFLSNIAHFLVNKNLFCPPCSSCMLSWSFWSTLGTSAAVIIKCQLLQRMTAAELFILRGLQKSIWTCGSTRCSKHLNDPRMGHVLNIPGNSELFMLLNAWWFLRTVLLPKEA